MIQFAFFRPDDDTHELSIFGTVCYYVTNTIALPVAYALIFLTATVLFNMYNNLTSLETMSRRSRKMPCVGAIGKDEYVIPNEYDMIWLTNFRQVLGSRMWLWWLPIPVEMKGQGFYFPKLPELTMADTNLMLKESGKTHNTSFTMNEFEADPRDYVKKAMKKYAGRTFIVPTGPTGAEQKEVHIPAEEEDGETATE